MFSLVRSDHSSMDKSSLLILDTICMIYEALIFLLTPTSPIAKKYGFLYQSIALQQRYKRCRTFWLNHLKSCQDLFLEAIKDLPQKKKVVILGSAHLHEIPLHLLEQNFQEIVLVDIIHPLRHHWLAKKNSRLQLVTLDLSNALERLDKTNNLEDLKNLARELENQDLFFFDADLIVSANIMSQLALLPMEHIEKKTKDSLETSEKDDLCRRFAEMHLRSLLKCKGKKLIYADREVIYLDKEENETYRGGYEVDFSHFQKMKEWIWYIAPLNEASKEYALKMKIEAYIAP